MCFGKTSQTADMSAPEGSGAQATSSNTKQPPLTGEKILLAADHYDEHTLPVLEGIVKVSQLSLIPCEVV